MWCSFRNHLTPSRNFNCATVCHGTCIAEWFRMISCFPSESQMRHQMIRAIWSSDDGHLIRHEKLRILSDHLDYWITWPRRVPGLVSSGLRRTSAACLRSVEGVEQQWEAILKLARNDSKLHVWRTQSDTHRCDPPKRSCQWIWPRTTWVWTKTGAPGTSSPEFRKNGKLKTAEYVTSCFSYTLAPKLASPATQSCRASNPVVSWSFFSQVKVVLVILHLISFLCFLTHITDMTPELQTIAWYMEFMKTSQPLPFAALTYHLPMWAL